MLPRASRASRTCPKHDSAQATECRTPSEPSERPEGRRASRAERREPGARGIRAERPLARELARLPRGTARGSRGTSLPESYGTTIRHHHVHAFARTGLATPRYPSSKSSRFGRYTHRKAQCRRQVFLCKIHPIPPTQLRLGHDDRTPAAYGRHQALPQPTAVISWTLQLVSRRDRCRMSLSAGGGTISGLPATYFPI